MEGPSFWKNPSYMCYEVHEDTFQIEWIKNNNAVVAHGGFVGVECNSWGQITSIDLTGFGLTGNLQFWNGTFRTPMVREIISQEKSAWDVTSTALKNIDLSYNNFTKFLGLKWWQPVRAVCFVLACSHPVIFLAKAFRHVLLLEIVLLLVLRWMIAKYAFWELILTLYWLSGWFCHLWWLSL